MSQSPARRGRRHGRRPAPDEIVAGRPPGRRRARHPGRAGRPTRGARRHRRARGARPRPRSSPWTTTRRAVRRKKDSSLVRRRRGGARRPGLGHGLGRQHRRHDGARLLRMGRIKGRRPARDRHADPASQAATPTVLLDAGANAECQPAWLVQFAQMGAVFARQRYGIDEPRVGLLSIGEEEDEGQRAGQGGPRPAAADERLAAGGLRRQRRGPRPDDRRRRRRRHRRLHRQRRPQDPRGRHADAGRRPLRAPSPDRRDQGRRRRPDAGTCCPSTRPRPGQHRRGHAPRRRRRLHHQPRLVVGHRDRQRRPGGRRDGRRPTWSGHARPAVADAR